MKKRPIIPPLPKPFVLTEKLEKNLKDWIQYLKNISPRILVLSVFDEDFLSKLKERKDSLKMALEVSNTPEEVEIESFPEDDQIAFIACFDSSRPGKKKLFLAKDGFVFCYGGFAFNISDLEQDPDASKSQGVYFVYNFTDWGNPNVCTWQGKAEIIQGLLIDIEKSVPKLKKVKSKTRT